MIGGVALLAQAVAAEAARGAATPLAEATAAAMSASAWTQPDGAFVRPAAKGISQSSCTALSAWMRAPRRADWRNFDFLDRRLFTGERKHEPKCAALRRIAFHRQTTLQNVGKPSTDGKTQTRPCGNRTRPCLNKRFEDYIQRICRHANSRVSYSIRKSGDFRSVHYSFTIERYKSFLRKFQRVRDEICKNMAQFSGRGIYCLRDS